VSNLCGAQHKFDWTFNKTIHRAQYEQITTGDFIRRRVNVGQSGVGKSHLMQAVGLSACAHGYRVCYTTSAQMLIHLTAALADKFALHATGAPARATVWSCNEFAVPFFLLLMRDLKRTPHRLVMVAFWILFVRLVDLFMLVSPEFDPSGTSLHLAEGEAAGRIFVHWLDFATPIGIGGLWVWMFLTQLRQRPLLAVGDPYLRQALETTGGH
jgi:hypothetical protein